MWSHNSNTSMQSHLPGETAESLLAKTEYIVEATSFEQLCLWQSYAKQSPTHHSHAVDWKEYSHGWLVTVGKLAKMPVCISVSWAKLDGHFVMFYEATSEVVDHRKIRKWLKKYYKPSKQHKKADSNIVDETDANNFHLCIQHIDVLNKEDAILRGRLNATPTRSVIEVACNPS